ncbi:MAG: D-alanyl-D-alanine carboxypeptidase/D-alanyl-D-alanine-endopeptidase [Campylobacterota bacterium]|nr:D-alanyl-D-alanine carboxypeptidase/D-alanyl-D-alanine-endopeptidase [Campylobacterota bacterium]
MKKIVFIFMLFSLWLFAMPQAIVQEIQKSGIAKKDLSIYIKEAGNGGKVVASLNAGKTRTPASVIKVLTTYAALLKLGFEYRWPTQFYTTGRLKKGVLNGDLLVKGFGDPSLNDRDLADIVATIRAKGIRKIRGKIVIDRSYFKVGNRDNSGFDNHTYSAYNAMPDAMMFNERVSTVCVTPNKRDVYKKNDDGSYKVIDKLKYVNKACKGKYSWPGVKIEKNEVMPTVILKGSISKRCGKRNVRNVLTKPYKSFYYALKEKLRQEGIQIRGKLELKKIPKEAKVLFTYYSDTLESIVSKTAKKSNNLYARHLLLLLGAKVYGAPATLQKGRDAISKVLRSKGALGYGTLMVDNGSGLSRIAKMTAKNLADMYDNAYDRYGNRWMQTLSIAGIDGTIKRRFRHTTVKKRAWMKTGTLKRVKNIGGYVKNKAGKLYTVVIMVNSTRARYHGAKLQNEIIKWLSKRTAKPRKKPITSIVKAERASVKKESVQRVSSTTQRYYIQVGSFQEMPNQKYLKKIEALNLRYSVRNRGKYRVLIGAYKHKSDAVKALDRVRSTVNKGAFIVKL